METDWLDESETEDTGDTKFVARKRCAAYGTGSDSGSPYACWSVSPLREAGTLLGVLRQEGLAGKGLIAAFEKWAPRIIGVSRGEVARLYREQTGRELRDVILIQKADKGVRNKTLPAEAEVVRQIIWRSRTIGEMSDGTRKTVNRRNGAKHRRSFRALYEVHVQVRSDKRHHDATVLVSGISERDAMIRARSEVGLLFAVPAAAVTAESANEYPLETFLLIDGVLLGRGWSGPDES